LRGKRARDAQADAAGGTGDDGDFSFEHGLLPPLVCSGKSFGTKLTGATPIPINVSTKR
jgi:hypothetical protein